MRLSRALSDLVKYTKSVRVHDIETQGKSNQKPLPAFLFSLSTSQLIETFQSVSYILIFFLAAFMSSWQVSSLDETVMNQILQLKPGELVRFNQRQLLRVYPSNYRVDSSNFNPQSYWNSGCHMGNKSVTKTQYQRYVILFFVNLLSCCCFILVAMNYQTEGRMLELNQAKFSSNGNCGYILKPKCMCKGTWCSLTLSRFLQITK